MEMSRLHYMVLEALTRQDELDPAIARLINAAFSSAQELEFALKSTQELDEKSHVEEDAPEVPKAFLKKVEVTGVSRRRPKDRGSLSSRAWPNPCGGSQRQWKVLDCRGARSCSDG